MSLDRFFSIMYTFNVVVGVVVGVPVGVQKYPKVLKRVLL